MSVLQSTPAAFSRRWFIRRLGLLSPVIALSSIITDCGQDRGSQSSNDSQQQKATVTQSSQASNTLGLGIVGLIVRDLKASLDFYRLLGLNIPTTVTGDNYRMKLPTGQVFFWDTYALTRSYDPGWQPSTGHRRIVLEWGFSSAQAVNDKYAELTAAGYSGYLSPRNLFGPQYALIKDPDGNEIGLRYPVS
ncbi:MAG: hypothetical protein M3Z24_00510 [Chloroflexota bacterium]|nr:hypothetical protein [Chloroflexota bacterium]